MARQGQAQGHGGDEAMTQKQAYLAQANQVQDNSRDATRRMVAMVEESKSVGIDTINELVDQSAQLDRVETNLDDIAMGIRQSEKHIGDMNKCCGVFTLPWKRWKKFDRTEAYKDAFDEKRIAKREKAEIKEENAKTKKGKGDGAEAAAAGGGPYVTRVLNDEAEEEMESNLNQVDLGIQMLKGMAQDMGTTIQRQNVQIDSITAKGDANEIGLAQNQHRLDRMMKGM